MRLIPFFIAAIFLPFLCLDIIPRHNSNSHKFNQLLPQLQKFSATSPIYSTNHPPKPKLRRPSHRAKHPIGEEVSLCSTSGQKKSVPEGHPRGHFLFVIITYYKLTSSSFFIIVNNAQGRRTNTTKRIVIIPQCIDRRLVKNIKPIRK